MRKVTFNFYDRLKLIPVDFIYARYKLLAAMAIIFVLSGITRHGFSIDQSVHNGFSDMIYIAMAYISGILLTPLILPIIPVRMFAFKGLITGSLLCLSLILFNKLGHDSFVITAWFLILSAISSFMAMNFIGASTFTSLSGVKKDTP